MINLVQLFQSIHCRVIDHKQNKIRRICIEKDCKVTRLVCDQCGNMHKSHRESLLTLAEVQDALVKFQSSSEFSANLDSLDQMINNFSQQAQELAKALLEQVQQLQNFSNSVKSLSLNFVTYSYEELDQQMIQLMNFVELNDGQIKFKIQKPQDLYPRINTRLAYQLQKINDFWQKNIGSEPQQQNQLLKQQQFQKDQSTQTQILQNEINTKSLQQRLEDERRKSIPLQDLLDFFKKESCSEQIKSIPLQEQLDLFTKESCSEQIKCISPKCVRKIGVNNTNDVACLNKSLSLQEKQSFVFRINRLTGYIGIGISIFQQVKENNFIFGPLDQPGHGVFMFLNNGLVYNNTHSQFNKINGSFELIEGQKYRLIFDPWNAQGPKLSIQSLSQKPTTFSMPMQIVEGFGYHVFVYMGQQEGEVELIDEI